MLTHFRPALTLMLLFTLLTGLLVPLAMTGIAGAIFPGLAGGSLITRKGVVIGSALIGQNFTTPGYFHPRPSATTDTDPKDATKTIPSPYNADNSSGSNLAPTAKALLDRVKGDLPAAGPAPVPADAVTTSASGLDPDITPENARRQVARVATARHLTPAQVNAVLDAHISAPLFGFIGEPHVNVLELNLALDGLAAQ